MHNPALGSQISASWRMCLGLVPTDESVDAFEIPRRLICFGPPIHLLHEDGEISSDETPPPPPSLAAAAVPAMPISLLCWLTHSAVLVLCALLPDSAVLFL